VFANKNLAMKNSEPRHGQGETPYLEWPHDDISAHATCSRWTDSGVGFIRDKILNREREYPCLA
jgi:hypothetical protein